MSKDRSRRKCRWCGFYHRKDYRCPQCLTPIGFEVDCVEFMNALRGVMGLDPIRSTKGMPTASASHRWGFSLQERARGMGIGTASSDADVVNFEAFDVALTDLSVRPDTFLRQYWDRKAREDAAP